ncbi:SMP-30/gluconolactonase/LRE family protein [Deminuibacter soli]|uniref:SMP-30/gluconolactonase/LRE family protein n=1 Tax=Deminuibacter soli TaxID=2291815 RepID=A0A3E1NG54_9BACT|nr:SMP-30/gluconolactonase/LRE family protein [Deminuibacter soli]RFM26953.1 SMP-30/gluconolactonase/LRE family protein [Deminuibacter soli]
MHKTPAVYVWLMAALIYSPICIGQQTTYPVAPGAKLQLVSDHFAFTEGPTADAAGNVYFTDQPNNRIWKYDTANQLTVYKENAGRANGMYFDRHNNLYVCADEHNQLWRINAGGTTDTLVRLLQGRLLNGPNDVWVSANGNVYLTDPYYKRDYWPADRPAASTRMVLLLRKGKQPLEVMDSTLQQPNGITGTPDGKYLYVSDLQAGKTWRYRINKKGRLTEKQLFVAQGSDGMTTDAAGNVYLCGNGVTVYNAAGQKIQHIPVPAQWTANVCFGGKNRNVLFITAGTSLFTLQMTIKGVGGK